MLCLPSASSYSTWPFTCSLLGTWIIQSEIIEESIILKYFDVRSLIGGKSAEGDQALRAIDGITQMKIFLK